MSDALTPTSGPIVHTIDATRPAPIVLPFSMDEMWVALGGGLAMALLGIIAANWLMLPWGATG